MSGLLAGKVWQSDLASHLKPLAAALADIANDDGTSIYPSVAYMAWLLGKGRRSVQTGLSELREAQIIEPVGHDKGGRGQPTEYRLMEANLPKRASWKELRKGAELAPFTEIKGAVSDIKGRSLEHERAQLSTERVQPAAPDPSVEPSLNRKKEPQQRGTRLPVDFAITETMRNWAKEHVPHVNVDATFPEFVDYWCGIPGHRGTKLNWEATWRNRQRDIEARASRNGNGTSKAERSQQAGRNLIARYEREEREDRESAANH